MTEPYNMTQEQRDAVTIARLNRQLDDAWHVIKTLVTRRVGVSIMVNSIDGPLTEDLKAALTLQAAHQLVELLAEKFNDVGALYERIDQYEQWFYSRRNNGVMR